MAIAFDAVTSGASSTSYSHTCTGSDRVLIVNVGVITPSVPTVTYGGVSMTQFAKINTTLGYSYFTFYLVNPASGSNTVSISSSGSARGSSAVSYTGVESVFYPDSFSNTSGGVDTAPYNATTTVVASNCWMVGISWGESNSGTATITDNKTSRATQTPADFSPNNKWLVSDSNGTVSTGAQSFSITPGTSGGNYYGYTTLISIAPKTSGTAIVNTLVVGGGGGGDNGNGGGGGGGGYKANSSFVVTPQAYTITVGTGGTGNNNGGDSIFGSITAVGGGGGGTLDNNGSSGASGGGGGKNNGGGENTGGTGTQGRNGGGTQGGTSFAASGGGGGAGGLGTNGVSGAAGRGGDGGAGIANSISGTSVTYAGGGRGLCSGSGGNGTNGAGQDQAGGGGEGSGTTHASGNDGIVIIAYKTDGSDGVSTASTGGTITTSGANTIHTFTTSGTWTMVATGGGVNSNFFQFF